MLRQTVWKVHTPENTEWIFFVPRLGAQLIKCPWLMHPDAAEVVMVCRACKIP